MLSRDLLRMIRSHSNHVLAYAHEIDARELSYDDDAVAWLSACLEQAREDLDAGDRAALVGTHGSFLGDCIIAELGGEWDEEAGEPCVRIRHDLRAYPYARVELHLRHGERDSVGRYFWVLRILAQHSRLGPVDAPGA